MIQITDRELAVYQMHKNHYTKNDIAKGLNIPEETVEWILRNNFYHLRKLAEMDANNERGVI